MDEAPRPVARVWQMTDGDLDDPSFAEAFCAEVVPRFREIPGYLGVFVLLDREHKVLRGLSLWESADAREWSSGAISRVVDAVLLLSSAEFSGPWNYDVLVSRFRGILEREARLGEVQGLMVRTARFLGGNVTDPDVLEVLAKHMSGYVAQAPGCVGSLLLVDRENTTVLAASFWVDAAAAERTRSISVEVIGAVTAATSATSTSEGLYEVLVSQPIGRHIP